MRRIATICVRKGSKGLANKNKLPMGNLPLFAHSVIQAKLSGIFDQIVVSTDDSDILGTCRDFGATIAIERPSALSQDDAGKPETVKHAVLETEEMIKATFDTVVDLDATSMLRNETDIVRAVELLELNSASSVLSVTPSRRNPYFNVLEVDCHGRVHVAKEPHQPIMSRQNAPETFDMNAAVHVWNREKLISSPKIIYLDTLLYVMPQERSHDIDTDVDFKVVEFLHKLQSGSTGENYGK